MNTAPLCTVIMVTLFALPFFGAITGANAQIVNMLCSTAQFTDDSFFGQALSRNTAALMVNAKGSAEYPFLSKACDTNFFMEAYCKESLGTQGCTSCFNAIEDGINKMCKNSVGVQAALQDCNIRYETYSFDQIEEKLKAYGTCPVFPPR